jgi:hypothetical protein
MSDVVSITKTVPLSVGHVVLKRSKIIDAIRRDRLADKIGEKHPHPSEQKYIRAFARCVVQTVEAHGLPFEIAAIDEGNADQHYATFIQMDEADIDSWYIGALDISAPVDPDLAAGVDTDKLEKKARSKG